ncbi:MAG: hypothetical protein IJY11_03755 [Clostridia bacterium]|nr:hypothetical protein [Clostridia bacterium]
MATIYPNRKENKIISFKFKACLGRDVNGKQIFKCTTWIPDKGMTEKRYCNRLKIQSIRALTNTSFCAILSILFLHG